MRLIPHDKTLGWTPYAWLIYILPFTLTPLYSRRFHDAAGWTLFLAVTVVLSALYFRSYWARGRELILVCAAMAAMGVAFWPISYGAGAMFIFAAAMIGYLEPSRQAIIGVAVISIIAVIEGWFLGRDWFSGSWPVVFSVLVGAINIHFSQVGRANTRLQLAQDEIEHLAKVAERERIARDLHDLLGHTLSLVILKSELAVKLSDRDPGRAREEIRDVERISREALAQVRAAVAGYRSGGIESEAQHAQSALGSAGVVVEVKLAKKQLPASHEAVLALALREAVTNIVRHANASKCTIALDATDAQCVLTVSDDGRGGAAPFGSGLNGMRERVEILGGTMTRDGRRGTTLTVTLPLRADARAERSAS
jgi:two-component system, NarL family, sensor histidine kinase DesK